MGLKIATAAALEPVTLTEAKLHCRQDGDDDDDLITALIVVAREVVEKIANRALITQTWDLTQDAFPEGDTLEIPLPPLQSITSITYVDVDANSDTVSSDDTIVDTTSEPGRVVLKSGSTWPSTTLRAANGVTTRFVAGYGDEASDVPQRYKQAILLLVGHWYENREETVAVGNVQKIPVGVGALLWLDRVVPM